MLSDFKLSLILKAIKPQIKEKLLFIYNKFDISHFIIDIPT